MHQQASRPRVGYSKNGSARVWCASHQRKSCTAGVGQLRGVTYQVHTRSGRTWSRESVVGEAYGLADRQSIKKQIDVFLVLWRPFLNALTVVESITCWSRLFHLSITRSWRLTSRRHLFFAILAEWPLVRVLSLKVNMLSKLITDHPLYILNTCSRSALLRLSSSDHNPRCSNLLSYDNCLRSGIILVNRIYVERVPISVYLYCSMGTTQKCKTPDEVGQVTYP